MKAQILKKEKKSHDLPFDHQAAPSETDPSPWSSRVIIIWLAGILISLPIKIFNLPLNFELSETWSLMGLPIIWWLYSLRRPRYVSLSYGLPIWLVLFTSFISAFTSPEPTKSLIVIFKEIYLFVWFGSVMILLFQLSAGEFRLVLRIWSMVVIGHGALMMAQFMSPEVWRLTNALGGNSANLEGYRAAGLFICDKAGCANKAAVFQLLGFVPLLLAGFPKRTTLALGVFLFTSMMTSGSMGATLAFSSGLLVSILAIAYFKNSLSIVLTYFIRIALAAAVIAAGLYFAGNQKKEKQNHFERIIVGRFDKSSSGRLDLWSRGIDALLEHNAFFWGVGPENFRVVDAAQNDNQLHNDTLAFLVERGLLGLMGLGLFAGITLIKALQILRLFQKNPERASWGVVIFLAALVATLVESLTHQVFHTRELWLVLAVQEAVLYKITTSENGINPIARPSQIPAPHNPELLVRPEVLVNG